MREAVRKHVRGEILERMEAGFLISGSSVAMTLVAMSRATHSYHPITLIQLELARSKALVLLENAPRGRDLGLCFPDF